jgi:hypothetical protein
MIVTAKENLKRPAEDRTYALARHVKKKKKFRHLLGWVAHWYDAETCLPLLRSESWPTIGSSVSVDAH